MVKKRLKDGENIKVKKDRLDWDMTGKRDFRTEFALVFAARVWRGRRGNALSNRKLQVNLDFRLQGAGKRKEEVSSSLDFNSWTQPLYLFVFFYCFLMIEK